jgi:hypothetical protein
MSNRLWTLDELQAYIQSLMSEQLVHIAARSYQHPLQFIKITLAEHADGSKTRLHYWFKTQEELHPHNHCWDFESLVLSGRLENVVLAEAPVSPSVTAYYIPYEFDATINDGYYKMIAVSDHPSIRLARDDARCRILGAGERYSMESKDIHRTVICEHGTITLVHQQAPCRAKNQVYLPPEHVDQTESHSHMPPMTVQLLNDVFKSVLEIGCLPAPRDPLWVQ